MVLHVVFQSGGRQDFIRTCEHREVPQVVDHRNAARRTRSNRPQREVAIAHPGRCVSPLKHLPAGAIERLLDEAAVHRANLKATRWLRTADAHGRDAALFQATAETLGYRGNSLPMRLLAQRAPLALLKAEGEAAEAVLFGTAGFLSPHLHEPAPPDTRDYLRGLWDAWWKSRARFEVTANRSIPWKTHGQRPANHPHRRVGALAALVDGLAAIPPARPRPARSPPSRWSISSTRSTTSSGRTATPSPPPPSPGRVSLFGRAHALELVANHLAPLAIHEDGMTFRSYQKLRNSVAQRQGQALLAAPLRLRQGGPAVDPPRLPPPGAAAGLSGFLP